MTPADIELPVWQRLEELQSETDREFVHELIDLFISEAPAMLQSIHDAIMKKDFQALQLSAHAFKGTSLNLGAKHIGALCFELEKAGRAAVEIPSEDKIDEIRRELESLREVFEKYKGQNH